MEFRKIAVGKLRQNTGQIEGLPANPRQWTRRDLDNLKASIEGTPQLLEARGAIVYPHGGSFIVLGGNMRLAAVRALGWKEMPCAVLPEDTPVERLREIVLKDNGSFGDWDTDAIANEWDDFPLKDWGVKIYGIGDGADSPAGDGYAETEEEEIARKEREFRERMAVGEISEEDEEYQAFLEKFRPKKTTDDCYTPELVYEAVADWVERRYGVSRKNFVRPFYPGGDYKAEKYGPDSVVVDNPPFSILSEIIRFYVAKGIRFFLFCPSLTQFSIAVSGICSLCVGVSITYENGAQVNTSFQTNMEDPSVRLKSEPSLYRAVKEANDLNLAQQRKELPKYSFDKHVITAHPVCILSRYGIEFSVPVAESERVSTLDSMKEAKRPGIYGSGYLVSERVAAERVAAEREKVERWELSEREQEIVARLNERKGK